MRQIWEDLCGLVRDLGPNCARWRAGVTGSLTPAQARRIVTGLRGPLVLEGVTELSPEAAGVLALHDSDLSLPSLREVSPEVARRLAGHKQTLSLDGCRSLSPEAAAALAIHGLEGIRKSTQESLAAQAAWSAVPRAYDPADRDADPTEQALWESRFIRPQTLSLAGLRDLTLPVAEALGQHKGDLILDGVRTISDSAAEALGNHFGTLELNSLRSLSPRAARALATGGGVWPACLKMGIRLRLNGLRTLSPEAATELAAYQGTLWLSGLRNLSPELAAALAQFRPRCRLEWLNLYGVKRLSPEAARNLASFNATLCLGGLTSVSTDLAAALVDIRGRLHLPRVRRVSSDVAEILMSRLDVYLSFTV
jgi:hypothetical protein